MSGTGSYLMLIVVYLPSTLSTSNAHKVKGGCAEANLEVGDL